jgi:hypothetical protein
MKLCEHKIRAQGLDCQQNVHQLDTHFLELRPHHHCRGCACQAYLHKPFKVEASSSGTCRTQKRFSELAQTSGNRKSTVHTQASTLWIESKLQRTAATMLPVPITKQSRNPAAIARSLPYLQRCNCSVPWHPCAPLVKAAEGAQ